MCMENAMKSLCLKLMPQWKFGNKQNCKLISSFSNIHYIIHTCICIHQTGISLLSSRWINLRVFKYFELESLLLRNITQRNVDTYCQYQSHQYCVYIKSVCVEWGVGVNVVLIIIKGSKILKLFKSIERKCCRHILINLKDIFT